MLSVPTNTIIHLSTHPNNAMSTSLHIRRMYVVIKTIGRSCSDDSTPTPLSKLCLPQWPAIWFNQPTLIDCSIYLLNSLWPSYSATITVVSRCTLTFLLEKQSPPLPYRSKIDGVRQSAYCHQNRCLLNINVWSRCNLRCGNAFFSQIIILGILKGSAQNNRKNSSKTNWAASNKRFCAYVCTYIEYISTTYKPYTISTNYNVCGDQVFEMFPKGDT